MIYKLSFPNNKFLNDVVNDIENLGFKLGRNIWITILK